MSFKLLLLVELLIMSNLIAGRPQFTIGVDESINTSSDPATQHILQSSTQPGRYIDKPQSFGMTFTVIPQVLLTIHQIKAEGTDGYGFSVLPTDITNTDFNIRYMALQASAVPILFVQFLALVDDSVEFGYITINQPITSSDTFSYEIVNPAIKSKTIYPQRVSFQTLSFLGINLSLVNPSIIEYHLNVGYSNSCEYVSNGKFIFQIAVPDGYSLSYYSFVIALALTEYQPVMFSYMIDYQTIFIDSTKGDNIVGLSFMSQQLDVTRIQQTVRIKLMLADPNNVSVMTETWGDAKRLYVQYAGYIYQVCPIICNECIPTNMTQCSSCLAETKRINPPSCTTCQSQYYLPENSLNCEPCASQCNECLTESFNCISCGPSSQQMIAPFCISCPDGMYSPQWNQPCQTCPKYCRDCENGLGDCIHCILNRYHPPDCLFCMEGYYSITGQSKCQVCPSVCRFCEDETGQCTTCLIPGTEPPTCECPLGLYYQPGVTQCQTCISYCLGCVYSSYQIQCIACQPTTLRTDPPICRTCPNQYYLVSVQDICQPCPSVCKTCENESAICTTCLIAHTELPNCNTCSLGFYFQPGVTECQPCPSYCLGCVCSGNQLSCIACQPPTLRIDPPLCQTCPNQYYLQISQDNCQSCPAYCNGCTSQTECISCVSSLHRINPPLCTQCEHQYYYDTITSNCLQCPSYCNGCTSATHCISCAGTRLNPPSCQMCPSQTFKTSTDCQKCPQFCDQCRDDNTCISCQLSTYRNNPPLCQSCPKYYYLVDNQVNCQKCDDLCTYCNVQSTNCIKCLDDNLKPPQCKECIDGYYMSDGSCQKCVDQCKICSDKNDCLICPATLYLQNNQCVTKCSFGYYLSSNSGLPQCQICPIICGNCQNETGICTTCSANRISLPNCDQCPLNFYIIPGIAACQMCPAYCIGCTYQLNSVSCITCQPLTLRINPPLCQTCPNQYYLQKGQDNCLTCPIYCNGCISETECIFCVSSLHRINPPLCQCEHQYYYDTITSNCLQCSSHCDGCTSATDCISCAGYRLNPPSCQTCPSQTFKTQNDCQTCPQICDQCIDENTCIGCQLSTYRSNPPLCQSCPIHYYADFNYVDCQKCDDLCTYCNVKSTNCLQCYDDILKPPQCKECFDGFYKSHGLCQKCDDSCLTCKNKTQCLSCNNSKYLQDYKCVSQCAQGYFLSQNICFKCSEDNQACICPQGCSSCNQQVCLNCQSNYQLKNGLCIENLTQLNTSETFEIHKTSIFYIYLLQTFALIGLSIKAYLIDKLSTLDTSPTRPMVTQVLPLKQINEEQPESGKQDNQNDISPLQSPQQAPILKRHQSRETSILKLKSPQGENITMFQSSVRIPSSENFLTHTTSGVLKTELSPSKPTFNKKTNYGLMDKVKQSQISPVKAYIMYLLEFHQVTNIFKHFNPDCSRMQRAMIQYTSLIGTMAFIYNFDYGSTAQQVLVILVVAPINKIYQVIQQSMNTRLRYLIVLSMSVLGNYEFFNNLAQGTTNNGNFKTIYYLCAVLFDNFGYQPLHLGIGFNILRYAQPAKIQRFLGSSTRLFLYGN